MGESIEFVRNFNDLSTDKGFQFEFCCDRCGAGYRTTFKSPLLGRMSSVLDAAGSVFGGLLGTVADVGGQVRSAAWKKAHDEALVAAIDELKPSFVQCPHCLAWVCRKSCWNTKRGLCKECAPDLGVEMSAAQAARSVEEVRAHAAMDADDKHLAESDWRDTIRATCPKCEAPLATNAKFCPECGTKLQGKAHCTQCGAALTPNAKFCPECGMKIEG